jgi:S-adenosylmethionine decarboxylase proenzyme
MKHLVGLLEDCEIKTIQELDERMTRVAKLCEFTVVSQAFHQFEPFGATGVLVLAESHFSAHTYPEYRKVYLDVFCCSADFDPKKCAKIIEIIFGGKLEWQVVLR